MTQYLVTYRITRARVFNAPSEKYIHDILAEGHGYEIIEIKEMPDE